jgi:hypothetical protein
VLGWSAIQAACGGPSGPESESDAAVHDAQEGEARDATSVVDGPALDGSMDGLSVDATSDAGRAGDSGADAGPADGASADANTACSVTGSAGAAASSGFTGTFTSYFALFDSIPCAAPADCVPTCVSAGGTHASCTQGEQCLSDSCPDGGLDCIECLPPTYWLDTSGALGQPGSGVAGNPANDIQAFDNGYNDSLEVTNFQVALPTGAAVRGIEFSVDRMANDGNAADQSVRILKGGVATGADRASSAPWPQTYTPTTYGGPTDTWASSWTATDVASAAFGISITPQYVQSAGNDTVDIDSVTVTVFYGGTPGCP